MKNKDDQTKQQTKDYIIQDRPMFPNDVIDSLKMTNKNRDTPQFGVTWGWGTTSSKIAAASGPKCF